MSTHTHIPKHIKRARVSSAVRMLAAQDDNVAVIDIFEPIAAGGDDREHPVFSARRCVEMIDYARERGAGKLVLRINSPGGEVIEALAIYDLLKGSGLPLEAEIYGIAASAATIVALACPVIRMAPQSQWMVHEPVIPLYGDLEYLRRQIDWFAGIRERVWDIYAAATGKTVEELVADHVHEVYYTPAEAIAYGWPVTVLSDDDAAQTEQEALPDPATDPGENRENHHGDDNTPVAEDDEEASRDDDPVGEDNEDTREDDRDEDIPALRAQLRAARQIIARMQADARRHSDNFSARVNAAIAADRAATGYNKPIPHACTAPRAHTTAERAAAYKAHGLAGLLRSL